MPARLLLLATVFCTAWIGPPTLQAAQDSNVRFAAGQRALAIPFRLEANVILLRVAVGASPPLSFILDTGAYSIIDTRHAKAIGLDLQRVGKTDSIGASPQDVSLVTDRVRLTLPGLQWTGHGLLAISLEQVQKCIDDGTQGDRLITLDGILGKEFFNDLVVEIDYASRVLNVYDPVSYQYTGRGESLPIEIAPQHIFVRAQVTAAGRAPVSARLLVDTGAATGLRLTRQFVEAHKIMPPRDTLAQTPECGLSGYAKETSFKGTLGAVGLGRFRIEQPETVFSQIPTPVEYDGFLGGQVLRNFRVIFDYSRRRMILEKASQ